MSDADPARTTALHLLRQLEVGRTSLDHLLTRLDQGGLPTRDRHFVRHLVLGTLRWQKRLDWIVDQFSHRPIATLSPWARQILRLGVYQIFWLDRVPPRAAVHTAVELAKQFGHRGIVGLVNAVLRRALREADHIHYPCRRTDPTAYLAVYYSHPQWLVERWLARWGEPTTENLLRAHNVPVPVYIRLNSRRTTAAELVAALEAEGLQLRPAGPLPEYFEVLEAEGLFATRAHTAGLFQVQDINAGLPAALLDPQPGEQVLDLCSAPGGKTTQMAIAMQDCGLIAAADRAPERLCRVRENAARLRLQSIRLLVQDARFPAAGGFDRVLADVPCSATGTLGRRPDARWRKQAEQLSGLAELQYAILSQAFACLRPGGVLVYSTCSLEEEENAALVERFLAATGTAVLEPATGPFPDQIWADRYLQTLPGRDPGDGSFAARIRKQSA